MDYGRVLRSLRNNIWGYDNTPNETKAARVLRAVKTRVLQQEKAQREKERRTGPYSGLTRAELARTGTCETDWY